MKKNKTLIITTIICILPIIFSIIFYNKLPEQMATHWGFNGEANGYSSKLFAAFGLPIFLSVINIVVNIGLDHDPKKENASKALIAIGKFTVPVLTVIATSFTLLWNMNHKLPITNIIFVLIGLLFVAIGNYLPKCKQNYTVGIKLPWTLNSTENWNKTHRFSGFLWIIGGLILLINGFINIAFITPIVVILISIIPCIYSFALYKKGI